MVFYDYLWKVEWRNWHLTYRRGGSLLPARTMGPNNIPPPANNGKQLEKAYHSDQGKIRFLPDDHFAFVQLLSCCIWCTCFEVAGTFMDNIMFSALLFLGGIPSVCAFEAEPGFDSWSWSRDWSKSWASVFPHKGLHTTAWCLVGETAKIRRICSHNCYFFSIILLLLHVMHIYTVLYVSGSQTRGCDSLGGRETQKDGQEIISKNPKQF